MAYEIPGFSATFVAAADLSANQYRFVNITSAGKVNLPSAGGRVVGVYQNKPKSNEATTVVVNGISIIEAGGAITAGDNVSTDGTGRAVAATTGNQIAGVALETASGAGIFIAVLLNRGAAAA